MAFDNGFLIGLIGCFKILEKFSSFFLQIRKISGIIEFEIRKG